MHLLNARTRQLEYFTGSDIPPYAILSHTWGKDEVLMRDLREDPNVESKDGHAKIRWTCEQALHDNLKYAWVDTCCIDKTSSNEKIQFHVSKTDANSRNIRLLGAELSEAINSMFSWYTEAEVCYAFLTDVTVFAGAPEGETDNPDEKTIKSLSSSRWFSRGWTLQELIAPRKLFFFGKGWVPFGSRDGPLLDTISETSGIDTEVLKERDALHLCSIAKCMSWAAKRDTTRKEDEANCLLGIFGVNLPLLYGERSRAFIRLQEEIIKSSTDQSIFAWGVRITTSNDPSLPLLASSARDFEHSKNVSHAEWAHSHSYALTNAGLRITLPMIKGMFGYIGILGCHLGGRLLGLRIATGFDDDDEEQNHPLIYNLKSTASGGRPRVVRVGAEKVASATLSEIIIRRSFRGKRELLSVNDYEPRILQFRLIDETGREAPVKVDSFWPATGWNASEWYATPNILDDARTLKLDCRAQECIGGLALRFGSIRRRSYEDTPYFDDHFGIIVIMCCFNSDMSISAQLKWNPDLDELCAEYARNVKLHADRQTLGRTSRRLTLDNGNIMDLELTRHKWGEIYTTLKATVRKLEGGSEEMDRESSECDSLSYDIE